MPTKKKGFFGRALSDYKRSLAQDRKIKKKARAVALKERERQEIRLARESEKIKANQRLKAFRKAQSSKSTGRGGVGSVRQFATNFTNNFENSFGTAVPKPKRRKRTPPSDIFD